MKTEISLESWILNSIIDHYKVVNPEFVIMIHQLVKGGHSPAEVELLIQGHCPPGSAIASHAYLLAESFHQQVP